MAFKMNNIIKLSNGRIFNLLEDDLTTQDYRELSGVEVREIREKQQKLFNILQAKKREEILKRTGQLTGFL
jgi:hypothetical protein